MTPPRTLLRLPRALDVVVAVVFGVLWVFAEVGRVRPLVDGDGIGGYDLTLGPRTLWIWLALYVVAIAVCRILPVVSVVIVGLVPALQIVGLLGPPDATNWPIYGATLYVAVALGASASRRLARTALVVGIVQAALVAVAMVLVGDWVSWTGQGVSTFGRFQQAAANELRLQWTAIVAVTAIVFFVAAWGAGFLWRVLRRRAADAEQLQRTEHDLREAAAELMGVKERAAIAQEVHDVLAHSLAVVIAIADGSRFLRSTRPEKTDESLHDIATTARAALTDLRGLMEELTESQARPMPDLSELGPLLDRVRAAGLDIELAVQGEPGELTPAQELSVVRIVQESLTNALRHAGGNPRAQVTLDWRGPGLAVAVHSAGDRREVAEDAVDDRRGFGIAGMKDRARLAGGWLTAGPDDDGYLVTAYVPVRSATEKTA